MGLNANRALILCLAQQGKEAGKIRWLLSGDQSVSPGRDVNMVEQLSSFHQRVLVVVVQPPATNCPPADENGSGRPRGHRRRIPSRY